nr:immunoglobulin heavy chain junction region [Mus musculus]
CARYYYGSGTDYW